MLITAYLKRETITALETKQPLLGVICPHGSLSLLPKPQGLLNFLCFILPARDACAELPPEIKEPFCIWHFLSAKVLGHRGQIASHFSLPCYTGVCPRCLFSPALISLFVALCCTFFMFSNNQLKTQKQHYICGLQWCKMFGCRSFQHHQREFAALHTKPTAAPLPNETTANQGGLKQNR